MSHNQNKSEDCVGLYSSVYVQFLSKNVVTHDHIINEGVLLAWT